MSHTNLGEASQMEMEMEMGDEYESTPIMVVMPKEDNVLVGIPKGLSVVVVDPTPAESSGDDSNGQRENGEEIDEEPSNSSADEPSMTGSFGGEPSRPDGGILPVDYPSKLKQDDEWRIKKMHYIPNSVEIRILRNYERVDWDVPRWIGMYDIYFYDGLRLSIPRLVWEVLNHIMIMPT